MQSKFPGLLEQVSFSLHKLYPILHSSTSVIDNNSCFTEGDIAVCKIRQFLLRYLGILNSKCSIAVLSHNLWTADFLGDRY